MFENPLISIETISSVKNELYACISKLSSDIPIEIREVDEALAWSMLFEYCPDLLPGPPIGSEDAFYNRYFWFKRFTILKQERDGYDAGLEQQVFQLLEQSEFDLDWDQINRIDAEAANIQK